MIRATLPSKVNILIVGVNLGMTPLSKATACRPSSFLIIGAGSEDPFSTGILACAPLLLSFAYVVTGICLASLL